MILAILQKHLNLKLGEQDVFVNVAGGVAVDDPAADLSIAAAVLSSFTNKPVEAETIYVGELGLLGEIRKVANMERRVKEAKKLGYSKVIGLAERHVRELGHK
jgi:DNA repair protein RadA/Sms